MHHWPRLWVWLVFSETPGASTMIGGAIVFVAVAAHLIAGASRTTRPSGLSASAPLLSIPHITYAVLAGTNSTVGRFST